MARRLRSENGVRLERFDVDPTYCGESGVDLVKSAHQLGDAFIGQIQTGSGSVSFSVLKVGSSGRFRHSFTPQNCWERRHYRHAVVCPGDQDS